MDVASATASAIATIGSAQAIAGLAALRQFRARPQPTPAFRPGVTIFKPLHGDEPMLEEALASFCALKYPTFQIVFGLQDPDDLALPVLDRVRSRFPAVDISVVVDTTPHGSNRKVANLINMYPAAKHDVIVLADSDIHAAPGYLDSLVAELARPGVALVTTLYTGIAARNTLIGQLGASQINHSFLSGALLARVMGREDGLGATMALTRQTLESVGGFHALADELADDAVLGQIVVAAGGSIALATTVPATTVPETRLSALFQHELRWARTIRSLAPLEFALSIVQYPLAWAVLCVALSGAHPWSLSFLAAVWAARAMVAKGIDRSLGLASTVPFWLLPVRDLLSAGVILASYAGDDVIWRGHRMHASRPAHLSAPLAQREGLSPP